LKLAGPRLVVQKTSKYFRFPRASNRRAAIGKIKILRFSMVLSPTFEETVSIRRRYQLFSPIFIRDMYVSQGARGIVVG
jgi:hypothetical protein